MKLFLSHAHDDAFVATATATLIDEVSFGLIETWQSSSLAGVQPGRPILEQVHEALRTCEAVISLITPTSLGRPWLLYESGFIAGQTGAQVIPVLFGLPRNELPAPMSDYVTFAGEDPEDVARLLRQLLPKVVPKPNAKLIAEASTSYCRSLPTFQPRKLDSRGEATSLSALGVRLLSKADTSHHIQSRLADFAVKKVTIVSYTNEVEAGTLSRYRIRGEKSFEIFKRSPFADLVESQACNLLRISHGLSLRPWDKANASITASRLLSQQLKGLNDVSVVEHNFDTPPIYRAYMFDDNEALIGFYELAKDAPFCEGSIYKGMGDGESLLVTDSSGLGRYLLAELRNHIALLKYRANPAGGEISPQMRRRTPSFKIKAILFDLDGVLIDSMPGYVEAWHAALASIEISIDERTVHLNEGRSSKETVSLLFAGAGQGVPSIELVDRVIGARDSNLANLPVPKLMVGAINLVRESHRAGLLLGVVTGSSRTGILSRLHTDFAPYFAQVILISGEAEVPSKPSPEPYLTACRRLGIAPENALVIENAPLGILSASTAGCHVVAVNTGPLESSELIASGASCVFPSCEHLAARLSKIITALEAPTGLAQPDSATRC